MFFNTLKWLSKVKHIFMAPYNLNWQQRPVARLCKNSLRSWAIQSAVTVKRLAVEREVKQTFLIIK